MRFVPFVLLILAACAARPLTDAEQAFTDTVLGDEIDTSRVRLVKGAVVGLLPAVVPVRPQTTCREKLSPPITEPQPGIFPAMAVSHRVFYTRRFWKEDFLSGYPGALDLREAMRLAHELTHVWQWQARDLTGYHPLKASREHIAQDDPYLVEIDPSRPFLDYGYEQQGVIVEEFVCCRALDPDGKRTRELTSLVTQVFPAAARQESVPSESVSLPWDGVETRNICS